jgi:aubergine
MRSSRNELVNPYVGTVIDNHVVDRQDQDFYLISQQTNQGTVNPTHYDVIHNTNEFGNRSAISAIQIFTYKLTHLYYNWPVSD